MTAASAPLPATGFDSDYFPARLNTSLNAGRYTILRKLGEGVSSSSWLVYNGEGKEGYKYLATKILTIDATKRHEASVSHELEFLKEIEARNDTDFLPLLRDHFIEQGPRGKHLCLVQDMYSTSVSSLRQSAPHKALPPYMVRNVVSMVLDALAQLHAMRIVHTGVKLDNLLVGNSLYSLDDGLQKYLEANPGQVEVQVRLGRARYPAVTPQPIPNHYVWDTNAFEAETMIIYLTGFSHAQRAGEQPTADCFGVLELRAPETILQSDFGPGVDIWAVGCITFELLVGRGLFNPEKGEGWTLEDNHLAKMIELTGQTFPDKMLGCAKLREDYFDNAGNLLRAPELTPVSLEAAMASYKIPNLSEDEIHLAADFIRACLKFDPEERATAEDLRMHKFLANAFRC